MIIIKQKISLIICAYNEENNISKVLDVLKRIKWLDQIIVVNDGSIDKTSQVVRRYKNVELLEHSVNLGKGAAIASGVAIAKNNLLIFLDADLVGLQETHLQILLSPVLFTKEADLCLGIFGKGEISMTNFANKLIPSITGQRAIWKRILPNLKQISKQRYGVDIFITKSVNNDKIKVVKLDGLSQVTKEEKSDLMQAIINRVTMYKDIYNSSKNSNKSIN